VAGNGAVEPEADPLALQFQAVVVVVDKVSGNCCKCLCLPSQRKWLLDGFIAYLSKREKSNKLVKAN